MTSRISRDMMSSVGEIMEGQVHYSTFHPAYRRIADAVSVEVASLAQKDADRRGRARPVAMPYALDSSVVDELGVDFPEFRMLSYASEMVGHQYYAASAYLGCELLMAQASRYSGTAIFVGGHLLSAMLRDDLDVVLDVNLRSPHAVHSRNRDSRVATAVMADMTQVLTDFPKFDYSRYLGFLSKRKYQAVQGAASTVKAGALCADLSQYAMSPYQFATAMLQSDASVGYVFFPYHPVMLMQDEGEIPGTGVMYRKDFSRRVLELKYPGGACGLDRFDLAAWSAWLADSQIQVGAGPTAKYYRVQLNKQRGPFMYAQVVLSETPPVSSQTRHALELISDKKNYLVAGWTLKNVASNPDNPKSWKRVTFLAPARDVDAVYQFCMALDQKAFTRHSVRLQLAHRDRVTLAGTTIVKGFNPTAEQLEVLTTAIYARAFVDRFESSQLTSEVMARLKGVSGFAQAGNLTRVGLVALWTMFSVWDNTAGVVADAVISMCDWLVSFFGKNLKSRPTFELVPEYITMDRFVSKWRAVRGRQYEAALKSVLTMSNGWDRELRGGLVLERLIQNYGTRTSSVDDVMNAAVVHTYHVHLDESVQSRTVVQSDAAMQEELRDAIVSDIRAANMSFDEAPVTRHVMPTERAVRVVSVQTSGAYDQDVDEGFVQTFNDAYYEFSPEVAHADIDHDIASLSYDPQDRHMMADQYRQPRFFRSGPTDRAYYESKINALGAPKRQETGPELVSAMNARNLSAPTVSLPQDQAELVKVAWENFLDTACVEDAREKLLNYQLDPVSLEENALRDWMSQAKPENVAAVGRNIDEFCKPLETMDVGSYIAMLKADVKPPVSDKPARERLEPQVIVYHEKSLSAMYSSIFRVLVRRFLSLIKPNIHVNLLKDLSDISDFIQTMHPFGAKCSFLENDFSKYDKSQDEFTFKLEQHVFTMLGMNANLLNRWIEGHEKCRLYSFVTGISLWLRYQRKSGDATTAFGNVVLNLITNAYVYPFDKLAYATFMGDDSSMVFHGDIVVDSSRVRMMAELFNLTAKSYVNDYLYFASTFFIIDDVNHHVAAMPDPYKRIEKASQPVPADNPDWENRHRSVSETCRNYGYKMNTTLLAPQLVARYAVKYETAVSLGPAIYSWALRGLEYYRNAYHAAPRMFRYA